MCCCPANTLDIKVILCKLNFRTNLERNSIGAFAMDVMVSQSWLLIFLLSFSSAQFCHATLCMHILLFAYIHHTKRQPKQSGDCISRWIAKMKLWQQQQQQQRIVLYSFSICLHRIRNIKTTLISMIALLSQYAIRNCRRLFLWLNTFQNANRHSNRK